MSNKWYVGKVTCQDNSFPHDVFLDGDNELTTTDGSLVGLMEYGYPELFGGSKWVEFPKSFKKPEEISEVDSIKISHYLDGELTGFRQRSKAPKTFMGAEEEPSQVFVKVLKESTDLTVNKIYPVEDSFEDSVACIIDDVGDIVTVGNFLADGSVELYCHDYYQLVDETTEEETLTGGSVSYYKIPEKPATLDGDHYIECKDIQYYYKMEAHLSQTFKACWRIAATKQGLGKKGGSVVYDCEKAVQFSVDMLRQEKKDMSKEDFERYVKGLLTWD